MSELATVAVAVSPADKFREYLTSRPTPQRFTRQMRDMVNYIFSKHNHFDADQLIEELKQEGFRVSRATVYRTLNKLVDAGLLRKLDIGPRKYFEHDYGYPQHEHLFCQSCHKMIEFQYPSMSEVVDSICRQHNFQMQGHSFIIHGICGYCNRAKMTNRRLDLV